MDLRFTPEEVAFRDDLRRFFRTEIPAEIRRKVAEGRHLSKEDIVASQRILNAQGLAVPHWPAEWGGRDWTPVQRYIYTEELQRAAVPLPLQFNVYMVGPVIAAFGSEEQKRRFLPATANLDIWWCQGFSEPGAGSDLASLKTRAERQGDRYVVNGQKAWTTLGQHADWIFCLVRTDREARKQRGISFLLIDMKTPGITVRPTVTIDGAHEVNEVFFDDVEVPAENLVGEENRGWDYAKFLLANERTGIARIGLSKQRIARAKRLARETPAGDGTLWDDRASASTSRRSRPS
jgi:alkylation response protein AidB-like acyl-CoA dehydrogenase